MNRDQGAYQEPGGRIYAILTTSKLKAIKYFMRRLRQFYSGLQHHIQLLLGLLLAFFFAFIFFSISVEGVHYTESTEFCSSCHGVMRPEIETHKISAHANVSCGSCHVGEGILHQLYYKVTAVRYLWTLPLQRYDRPLASARSTMRSTKEICQNCHSPGHLHPPKLVVKNRYGWDDDNTLTRLLLILKIEETGDEMAAHSTGAHWHVNNPVYFVSPDEFRQEIPWVQIEKDGNLVEYTDVEANPAAWHNAETQKVQMDCIDCHSRAGHSIMRPNRAIDRALSHGLIAADLPSVKAQGVAVLDQRYESDEVAFGAIAETIRDFYDTNHPELVAERQSDIDQATAGLVQIYQQTQFPHMNVYWNTYPENTGHIDFPGCFRCHDGAHLNGAGKAIPAECNLCHDIPKVVEPGVPVQLANMAITEAPESHQSSHWLAQHRFEFDATCDDCHSINNPGGSDNSSMCSNSACHATDWTYLNIDSPAIMKIVAPQRLAPAKPRPDTPHSMAEVMQCEICHKLKTEVLPGESNTNVTPTATAIPTINHTLEGDENCLECHAVDSTITPVPVTHSNFVNTDCGSCHHLAPEFVPSLSEEPGTTAAQNSPKP